MFENIDFHKDNKRLLEQLKVHESDFNKISKRDLNGMLAMSIEYGHIDVAIYLVEKNDNKEFDLYALRLASKYGYIYLVKFLVEIKGADHKSNDGWSKKIAKDYDRKKILKYFARLEKPQEVLKTSA